MKRLRNEFSKLTKPSLRDELYGEVGATIGGRKKIDVPNRDGFIYVRLRSNPNEFVQVYNENVQNLYYGFPVKLKRIGNRYVVIGKDTQRYPEWIVQQSSTNAPDVVIPQSINVLRHGGSHSFDATNNQGGGDIAWIYSRQFLPLLVSPYSASSQNVYIVAQTIRSRDGDWIYAGNTGTINLVDYKPMTATGTAYFGLVYLDSDTGNPGFIIDTGSFAPAGLTGTMANILPYVPSPTSVTQIPLAFVRLETGTTSIGWDNLYDARPFFDGGSSAVEWGYIGGDIENQTDLWDELESQLVMITEDLTSQVNGTGTYFRLTTAAQGLAHVYCNVRQRPSAYSMVSGSIAIQMTYTPTVYDHLVVDYQVKREVVIYDGNTDILLDGNNEYILDV